MSKRKINKINKSKPFIVEWSLPAIKKEKLPEKEVIYISKITFKDVYEFPLKMLFEGGNKVITDDYKMAFDFVPSYITSVKHIQISSEDREKIIRIVNGSDEKISKPKNLTYENGTIYLDGLALIWIRGWGNLTGIGGLNLPTETAIKIQNDFAEYILTRIKNAFP